jgi:integrase
MRALATLQQLATTGHIPARRVKDIKTALRKLADALQVPVERVDLSRLPHVSAQTLETYFAQLTPPASPHTVRNTRQNLAQLYDRAVAAGLISTGTSGLSVRGRLTRLRQARPRSMEAATEALRDVSSYRAHHQHKVWERCALPVEQWPHDLARGWREYSSLKAIEVRQVTVEHYYRLMRQYVGYNMTYEQPPVTTWDQLFELPRILRYVAWLAERVKAERISSQGYFLVIVLVDIAKHQERPDYAALQKFKRRLPQPAKIYDKQRPMHTVSLPELDEVGRQVMDRVRQYRLPWERTGEVRAARFASGLMIRLLVRCPRRSKEIREMDLGGRLYQDDRGVWHLRYLSHQLKIEEHQHRPNEFNMPWPADLVDDLEEYLRDYRPKLLRRSHSTAVFLTTRGQPLNSNEVWTRIAGLCFEALGKHLYPHIFRTLWTDAYLDAHPGDYEGAAAMLNDTPATVEGWYRQFRVERHLRKGIDFNAQLFGHGKGNGKATSPSSSR